MKLKTIAIIVVWLAIAGGLFYFIDAKLNPNKVEQLGTGSEVTLVRDPSGHYRAEAIINGIKARVLVDTGATDVAISQRLADELGLESHAAIRTHTANGETVSYMTRLKTVKLGGVEAFDVGAIITPNLEGDALLGMSFLGRMDVRLYKGRMTIRPAAD